MLELRNQLYWKLYVLLPFSDEVELNQRYARISGFERGSGQFGKLRRGNERAATAVALKNLSLNAGLPEAEALRAFAGMTEEGSARVRSHKTLSSGRARYKM